MDARETLERRIDELCRENEQLRGTVDRLIGRSFRTADKMDYLNAETERLRQEIKTLERECEAVEHMYQSVRSILRNVVRTICATCPDKDMCERCYLRPYLYREDGRYREEA